MRHPKGFPARLLRLRAQAGMTQKELAKASGISLPQISRYESGTSVPRMTALVKLANALKVDISLLQDTRNEPAALEVIIERDGHREILRVPEQDLNRLQETADAHGVSVEHLMRSMLKLMADPSKSFRDMLKDDFPPPEE